MTNKNKYTHNIFVIPADQKTGFEYVGWSCLYDDKQEAQEYFKSDLAIELYDRFICLATESMRQAEDHKKNGRETAYARAKVRAIQAQECAGDLRLWLRLNNQDLSNSHMSRLIQAVKLIIDEYIAPDSFLEEGLLCGLTASQQHGILEARNIIREIEA